MFSLRKSLGLVLLTLAAAACGTDKPITAPTAAAAIRPAVFNAAATSPIWASTFTGTTGPGAEYALFVPEGWNGALVVYAHGYVMPTVAIQLPDIDPLRDALGANHFAVAYSSYSQNGFDVKDGAQRTHQLKGLFIARFGKPVRTYIMGHSLGGAITQMLAETHPGDYDCALPMCGFVGGSQSEVNYIANVRVLFDVFYPGVLPGTAMSVPNSLVFDGATIGALATAIGANPMGAYVISQTQQTGVPIGAHMDELGASVISALGFQIFGTRDVLDRTHGHIPFDNATTVYSSDNPAVAPALQYANAVATRFTATPDAAAYLQKYYEPDGRLSIPMITLHTTRDPIVPAWHEGIYAGRVHAAGRDGNLVQRSVDGFGHCTFSGLDQLRAFGDLVNWVEHGVVPAP